jgi:hypothetical protein
MSKTANLEARKALCDLAATDLPAGGHTARLHAALTVAVQTLEGIEDQSVAGHHGAREFGNFAHNGLQAIAEKLRA